MTTQKMTEEEAIGILRGCKSSLPGFDKAIRTVCNALESATKIDIPRHMETIHKRDREIAHLELTLGKCERKYGEVCDALEGARRAVPADLWSFLRDVLRQGAAIESQQGAQGYETFIAHIEAEASRQEKKLRAMLAAAQAQPAVDVEDICNAYESGVGHNGRKTAFVNPYPEGSHEHEAYRIGATGTKHNAQPAPETAGDARDAVIDELLSYLTHIGFSVDPNEEKSIRAILAKGDANVRDDIYSQGIMHDGPVILCFGRPMTPDAIVTALNNYRASVAELESAAKKRYSLTGVDELAALAKREAVAEGLWSFLREVLRQGAAIESQQGAQGYETFIAHIEAEASRQEKKLRAMLAAAQAQPAVDVEDICNAYESGVGHNGRKTAFVNPYPEGSHEHEAYRIGATGTKHNAQPAPETAGDARDAIPEGWLIKPLNDGAIQVRAPDDRVEIGYRFAADSDTAQARTTYKLLRAILSAADTEVKNGNA